MVEKTGDSPQNEILERLEQAERQLEQASKNQKETNDKIALLEKEKAVTDKEIAFLKDDIKDIRVSLLPKEAFNVMIDMQKETLERQKLNTQYSEERDMRLSRIETTLSTSIIHSMGLAELFVKTSLGALLMKIIAFIFVLMTFVIISFFGSVMSESISVFIQENGAKVFTIETLISLVVSAFFTRKGVKKHEKKN